MIWNLYLCSLLLFSVRVESKLQKLQELFAWNVLDFEYASDFDRVNAMQSQKYVPENNLPVGIEVWRDKLFISVPRWRAGIPSTLNYVPINSPYKNPRLIPYPNFESNELGNCENGLSTVYRIKADICDRLWVLDTGTFGIANTTTNPCPYALNIIDLNTNTRIRRYVLRAEDINVNTFIANIAVDIPGSSCDDAYAYLSDELGYGLIVYSYKENKSWRFTHSYFMPDPLAGDFTIEDINFQWGEEGIFGLSLSPVNPIVRDRILYFSPLASNRGFAVSTRILQNSSNVEGSYHDFLSLPERGPKSHTTSHVMSDSGIELFNLIDQNAIGCWNSKNPYNSSFMDILERNDETLVFPADVKIDAHQNVWVISDKMSTFLLSNLDYSNINFRVLFAPLSVLVKGSICSDY